MATFLQSAGETTMASPRTLQARPSYASKWILPGLYDPHPSSSISHMSENLIHDVWQLSLASIDCIVKFVNFSKEKSLKVILVLHAWLNLARGSHEQPGTGVFIVALMTWIMIDRLYIRRKQKYLTKTNPFWILLPVDSSLPVFAVSE